MRRDHPLIPASRVAGTAVYDRAGEKLGSLEDVAIDKVSGQVAYAILAFGGFLGWGERHHPVPWSLLRFDRQRQGYVIPCDRERLRNAPSFKADDLSGWDDSETREDIFEYYRADGARPYWMWAG